MFDFTENCYLYNYAGNNALCIYMIATRMLFKKDYVVAVNC